MSFQAYLDNIRTRTGKGPAEFRSLAEARGLLRAGVKTGEIVAWLKEDFGLGHGHAMAIVVTLKSDGRPASTPDEQTARHFRGDRAGWAEPFARLVADVQGFGPDVSVAAGGTYLSLRRGGRKFGIVQATRRRLDIGIKARGAEPTDRFAAAGDWNRMVTHRVQITEPVQVDAEVVAWLRRAYEAA
jgi:hypothetical protein